MVLPDLMAVPEMVFDFVMEHWLYIVIGAVVLMGIMVYVTWFG